MIFYAILFNKLIKGKVCFLTTIFALCLLISLSSTVLAQNTTTTPVIDKLAEKPFDPSVLRGKLDNGLTYYIKENNTPRDKALLYLVVKAGSILEDSTQQGLAHFVEHMAFNGTDKFPKNDLISFLETNGVKFGSDLNAFTSFNETVYMIPIQSNKLDSALLVLSQWAGALSLNDAEIDSERGVILEEMRTGLNVGKRIQDKWLSTLFSGSLYPERLPIGKKEILEKFPYSDLKRFYTDWYRPDLMAVIAVGSFEDTVVLSKIKSLFSDLKSPLEPKKREEFKLDISDDTLNMVLFRDKELTTGSLQIVFKHNTFTRNTLEGVEKSLMYNLLSQMFATRLKIISDEPSPPFLGAGADYDEVMENLDVYFMGIASGPDMLLGIKRLLLEHTRVLKYGFSQNEFDVAVKNMLFSNESFYKERNNRESSSLVQSYMGHFLDDKIPSTVEYMYEVIKKIIPTISLSSVNSLLVETLNTQSISLLATAPEDSLYKMPTKEEFKELLTTFKTWDVEAPSDTKDPSELMATPKNKGKNRGKIVDKIEHPSIGTTEYILSNGLRIFAKPTDFKDDEIFLQGNSYGGSSLFDTTYITSVGFFGDVINGSGIGNFSQEQLDRILAGKRAGVALSLNLYEKYIAGSCSKADLETMFQLFNLQFTAPRIDSNIYLSALNSSLESIDKTLDNPSAYFSYIMGNLYYQNNPYLKWATCKKDLDGVSLPKIRELNNKLFCSPAGFNFVIVGSFELKELERLLSLYVATIPCNKAPLSELNDIMVRVSPKIIDTIIYSGVDDKSRVVIKGEKPFEYNHTDRFLLGMAVDILNNKLLKSLREDMGGVYGVGAGISFLRIPQSKVSLSIGFPCSKENYDTLSRLALMQLDSMLMGSFTDADVEKVKEIERVNLAESLRRNRTWISNLLGAISRGDEPEYILGASERIEAVTKESLLKVWQKYIKDFPLHRFVQFPNKEKPSIEE